MIYFYFGLGLAMLTVVSKVFEVSTAISKQSYIDKTKSINIETLLTKNQNDKIFLKLLKDINGKDLGTGNDICNNIKNGITNELDTNYSILSKYSSLNSYRIGNNLISTHQRLVDGCDLVNNNHRVLIVPTPNTSNQYSLYSCIVEINPNYRFEFIN